MALSRCSAGRKAASDARVPLYPTSRDQAAEKSDEVAAEEAGGETGATTCGKEGQEGGEGRHGGFRDGF